MSRDISETHIKSGSHDSFLEAPSPIQDLPIENCEVGTNQIKNCEVVTNQMIEDFTLYGLRKFAMAEKSKARCVRGKHTSLSSAIRNFQTDDLRPKFSIH